MGYMLMVGRAIEQAKGLPANGESHHLPCGLLGMHFPADRAYAEQVVICDGHDGVRCIKARGRWSRRFDRVTWQDARMSPDRIGQGRFRLF